MKINTEGLSTDTHPSHEQITVRAELLWIRDGFPGGRDEQIWLEAERQLLKEAVDTLRLTPGAADLQIIESVTDRQASRSTPKRSPAASGSNKRRGSSER